MRGRLWRQDCVSACRHELQAPDVDMLNQAHRSRPGKALPPRTHRRIAVDSVRGGRTCTGGESQWMD